MSMGIQRKLTAILAADVVGYSRLMGADEAGTLGALRQMRTALFAPAVASHNGTIVKNMGEGWLVAFDSATDAVSCAMEVQGALAGQERCWAAGMTEWVKSCLSTAAPKRSALGGEADEIGVQADLAIRMSALGGRAVVVAAWADGLLCAITGP